jgi:hypothetical protein
MQFVQAQQDSTIIENETNSVIINDLENSIESLIEQSDEETVDYSELVDEYMYYSKNKINLNSPDYQVLMSVFGLSDYQVYHLQRYLSEQGQMLSIYELHLIEGMDSTTIARLIKFVDVLPIQKQEKLRFSNVFKYGKHRILMRYGQVLEEQQGYSAASEEVLEKNPNARYLGSPQAYLLKYNFNYKNRVRFGFTADKDAGEEFFKGSNKYGFDFYSFHIFLNNPKIFKRIALGDYKLSFGQGLAMNMGFSMRKPENSIEIAKNLDGLSPYTSANEYNFLRGIATTIDCKVLEATLFYSYRKLDASLSDTLDGEVFVESLSETGYHRTPREVEKKNAIGQHLAGVHLERSFRIAKIGATAFYTRFDNPLNRNLSLYSAYQFNEQDNINASIDYRVLVKKASFFGEVAMSKNLAVATVNGVSFLIHSRFSLSVLHRYYAKNYQSLHANAFGESSNNADEQGFFVGCQTVLSRHFVLQTHFDYFRFNWLKYRIDAPSDGYETQVKLNYTLNQRFSAYFRFKYKSKSINYATDYYNEITQNHRQSYRLHFTYSPLNQLILKSRIEIINFKSSEKADFHQGYIIYQDLQWAMKKVPIVWTTRFALFDTYSYDERVYAYENDVLYYFSSPFFYDKGSRIYLMGKVSITSHIDIWAKIAQTFYRNKYGIGSGLTYIDNNKRTEIRLQMLVKF